MPLYEINDDELAKLESTSFRDEKMKERQDLQRLLKTNIEAIDPGLMIIAEEFGDWDDSKRRIDLLAVDKNANLVVIELKRTDDGGHMELQAIRYAAMVANMTWEQAINAYEKYLGGQSSRDDAETRLLQFLTEHDANKEDFGHSVRIILASGNFSKELTTAVLWLNEQELDICCVRLTLHRLGDRLIINSQQIIPLPETESYQIGVRQKKREEREFRSGNKDYSLYSISYGHDLYEGGFNKSNIAHHTIRLLQDNNLLNDETFEFLREDKSCSLRLLKSLDEMTETEKKRGKYRLSEKSDVQYRGCEYYVARNWSKDSVEKFTKKITERFPKISYTSTSPEPD